MSIRRRPKEPFYFEWSLPDFLNGSRIFQKEFSPRSSRDVWIFNLKLFNQGAASEAVLESSLRARADGKNSQSLFASLVVQFSLGFNNRQTESRVKQSISLTQGFDQMSFTIEDPNGPEKQAATLKFELFYLPTDRKLQNEGNACFTRSLLEDVSFFIKNFMDYLEPDLILKASDGVIKTHKILLLSRSNVFRAIYAAKKMEGNEDPVQIDVSDFDCDLLHEINMFLKTDDVRNLEDFALDLLVFAEKYNIPKLKYSCETHLSGTIDEENCQSLMSLSTEMKTATLERNLREYCMQRKF